MTNARRQTGLAFFYFYILLGLSREQFFTFLDTALNTKSTGNFSKMDIALNSGRCSMNVQRKIVMSTHDHRVHRGPGFLSSSPIWLSPPPHPASECCPPLFGSKGGTNSLGGEGAGGANSDEGTGTLVLYVYIPLRPCPTF
jgi:hypothetical protein